jgi:hypothetical protein
MSNDNELRRFEHAGRTVVIEIDRDPINPCKDYDNFTKIVCWHRHAELGNETNYELAGMSQEEVCEYLKDTEGETVLAILPVYLLEHSGRTMRTTPFGDRWDSGQVGWAFVTEARAKEMTGDTGPIPTKEELEKYIRGDVETYDQYLTGEVYGYRVLGMADEDGEDGDELESCWGFFGELDYVISEAKSAAEHSEDPAVQAAADELDSRATYAGYSDLVSEDRP